MQLTRKHFIALAAALVAGSALAQGYPTKPITLVVPAAAGGTTDLAGRMLAQGLSTVTGQQVVVHNKGGGNGAIAASIVKRAPADGYTLLMQYSGFHVISPHLMKQRQWELADFQPIANVISAPQIIVVRDGLPVKTLAELVAYALEAMLHEQPARATALSLRRDLELARAARACLDREYRRPPNFGELAREIGTSQNKLKAVFKEAFGLTMADYCLERRMREAQLLLMEAALTIAQVAERVGYEHQSSFTAAFRGHVGMSPREYRRHRAPFSLDLPG